MAADTDTIIDTAIDHYDQVSSSDSDNTNRRARWLQWFQEALDEIWISGDWTFSYTTGTVTVSSSTDSGDLPADFMEFGEVGGIFDNTTTEQMSEIRPVEAYSGVITSSSGENQGGISNYGQNSSTQRRTLHLPGNAGSSQTIKILYRKVAPTLVDTTGSTSNLWQLPVAYHNTVLLPLATSKGRDSHGDSRQFQQEFLRGLGSMIRRERHRKTTVQRLPSSIRIW